jgi:hypothetical protein
VVGRAARADGEVVGVGRERHGGLNLISREVVTWGLLVGSRRPVAKSIPTG